MSQTSSQHEPVSLTREGESILFPALPYDMHGRSRRAVDDVALVESIETATWAKHTGRINAFNETFGERYDDLRALAGRIKQHTLDHLDHYLERFIDAAEAAGVQVHFAADAEEANAICCDIARREKLTACVKSKSMVTEETHLLPALEKLGIETLETDLGEFILQLDHDAPSHIVTPMIHKNRQVVARAFVRELGAEYTEDPEALTRIARRYLREKYRRADLGISGGNFLVAESGSMVICTNEGNATFCTTGPRVHVAFVGIEKLVPTREHLSVFLKLLARSSTAQPLTIYTDIITGPKRSGDADGPEQVHIILVDNGRTKILADEEMRQTLRCIRCGACLNACPVYRKVGGHSYGAVYSGPIGALITPLFKGLANYKGLPYASSLCGACGEACPVKIDIPRLLVALRRNVTNAGYIGWLERLAFRGYGVSLKRRWTYELAGRLQRAALRFKADRDGYVKQAPGPFRGWTDVRDLPAPAKQSFREWWSKRSHGATKPRSHEGKPGGSA